MNSLSKNLVNSYTSWLEENISAAEINGYIEITTPFLDRDNDYLQIYVKQTDTGLELTDDGYILSELSMIGVEINSKKRKDILDTILNGFGVSVDGHALTIKANLQNYPQRKHALIQAMLGVNDMFMTARPTVVSLFLEDVRNFLEKNEIRFTSDISFTGKSGYTNKYDFVIPASRQNPKERIIKAINNPDKNAISLTIFSWNDTREVRKVDSSLFAFLNDTNRMSDDALSALKEYDITPVLWSQAEQYKDILAS